MRSSLLDFIDAKWNMEYIQDNKFWLDMGAQLVSRYKGSALIRINACNQVNPTRFYSPSRGKHIKATRYVFAGTEGGSISFEIMKRNLLRSVVTYVKGYNPIKEQFYTTVRGHSPFNSEYFELMGMSKSYLDMLAVGVDQGGLPTGFSKDNLIRQWEATKKTIYDALYTTRDDKANEDETVFPERQEFRITLHLLKALPKSDFLHEALSGYTPEQTHPCFWILSTSDLNKFRITECNRWIACIESAMQAASYQPQKEGYIPIDEQDLITVTTTALAQTLRQTLGGLNPAPLSSIWKGKRWTRGRIFKHPGQTQHTVPVVQWQKRQGLNYEESLEKYGMIWILHYLCEWSHSVPYFKVQMYPHLDVQFNCLRANARALVLSDRTSKEGRFREYIHKVVKRSVNDSQIWQPLENGRRPSIWSDNIVDLFAMLSQLVIRDYNMYVWMHVQRI
ncbi:hypothetical protein PTNB85_10502 [Pyrenophora teres f. teres]|nr:hypothetical protein PTNB85_10502 [Pyrenophora teres f. teres]